MRKLLKLFTSFVALLFIFPIFSQSFASHKVFQDNFDDGNADGWNTVFNTCFYNNNPAQWEVADGKLGIKINSGSCYTEMVPTDANWDNLGNNYTIEFDMDLVGGTDHNFGWRWTAPNTLRYDLHIQSPNTLVLQFVGNTNLYSNVVHGDFSNGQTIHFVVEVLNEHIKIYRGSSLILDYPDAGGVAPNGKIALEASAGGDPNSETYFDNIVVTSIDDILPSTLPVPYYTQNSLPWGPSEYDHAKSLGFSNTTMDRWGCAVTSAAMVLNYHGMTQLQDNTPLNPGSLNQWLKTNNGYLTGTGTDGTYSYLSWPAISKLTEDLFEASKSAVKLVHNRATPSASTTTLINEDLTLRKFPDILWVKNASTSGHFVVAKGIVNDTYAINDPEWNVPNLSSFNNSYMQVDRYVPSGTNFSYIVVVVNASVEILVTDPLGKKTGKYIHNGQTQTFNGIPNASYSFQDPISNPNDLGIKEQLGTGVNEFLLPESTNGNYSITLSSSKNTTYTINLATFEENGEFEMYKKIGAINFEHTDDFEIQYSQTDPSIVTHAVTFESFIADVKSLRSVGEIKNLGIYVSLLAKAKIASVIWNTKPTATQAILTSILKELNAQRGKGITEDAYQTLLYDVNYLKEHL